MGPNPSVCMVSAILLFMGASMVRRLPEWRVRHFEPVTPARRMGVRVAGLVLIALGLLSVAVA